MVGMRGPCEGGRFGLSLGADIGCPEDVMPCPRRTALALLATTVLAWPGLLAAADSKTVAVTAIVEHPALDAVRDGIKAELAAGGYEDGKNLRFLYESAQGNPATAAQIARK